MRIGTAAEALGVAPHVLRHWEDVGVLEPARSSAGHRDYDEEVLTRARLVLVCQAAGLSLAQVRELGASSGATRRSVVAAHRAAVAAQRARLESVDVLLGHLLECRHEAVSQCPECTALAGGVAGHR